MILQIDDNWRLVSDSRCWQVQRYRGVYRSGRRSQEPKWRAVCYCVNLGDAVDAVIKRMILDSGAVGPSQAIEAVRKVVDAVLTAQDNANRSATP